MEWKKLLQGPIDHANKIPMQGTDLYDQDFDVKKFHLRSGDLSGVTGPNDGKSTGTFPSYKYITIAR